MKIYIETNEQTSESIVSRIGCVMVKLPVTPRQGDKMAVTIAIENSGYGVFTVFVEEIGNRYVIRAIEVAGTMPSIPTFGIVRKNGCPHLVLGNPVDYVWTNATLVLRSFDYYGDDNAYTLQDGWDIIQENPSALPTLYPPLILASIGTHVNNSTVSRNVFNAIAAVGEVGPWDIEYSVGHLDVVVNGFELTPGAFEALDGKTFKLTAPLTIESTVKAVGWTGR